MRMSVQYARAHFDEILLAAERGEEVEIARDDKPALTLVAKPVQAASLRPRSELFGSLRGKMWISPDFSSPELNKEIEDEFLNGPLFPSSAK